MTNTMGLSEEDSKRLFSLLSRDENYLNYFVILDVVENQNKID